MGQQQKLKCCGLQEGVHTESSRASSNLLAFPVGADSWQDLPNAGKGMEQ